MKEMIQSRGTIDFIGVCQPNVVKKVQAAVKEVAERQPQFNGKVIHAVHLKGRLDATILWTWKEEEDGTGNGIDTQDIEGP